MAIHCETRAAVHSREPEALHALGPRAGRPLVRPNCAAMPEPLLESELFGHERGAFSGAAAAKPGLFEHAHGGTLFLDEIGDTSPALQAKLLRVLEDGCVRRVGALEDRRVDVRVVAATHRDLRALVAEGRFRADLYYRLGGLVVAVPPLRDRAAEIPLLAERFAAEASRAAGRPGATLTEAALDLLQASPWPGNVRELRAVVHRAVVGADSDTIDLEDVFPGAVPGPVAGQAGARARGTEVTPAGIPLVKVLRGVEREEILAALDACEGNQTRAAELLGMPRRTLVWRMAKLKIDGTRIRRDPTTGS